MKKWEHKIEVWDFFLDDRFEGSQLDIERRLNSLSEQGWRVKSFSHNEKQEIIMFVLIREKEEETKPEGVTEYLLDHNTGSNDTEEGRVVRRGVGHDSTYG